MTCERCQELFSEYFDEELSSEDRSSVSAHLETCSDCRSEFDHYSSGLKSLQDSGSVEASGRFATDVMMSLKMEALSPAEEPPSLKRGFIGAGIAALMTLSFIGGLFMRPSSEERVREVVREIEVPSRGEAWESVPREMERAVLRKLDLVKYRGFWISREMRDGFVAGQVCLAGRMMDPEEASRQMGGDTEGESPSLQESLRKLGYEKTPEGFVPKEWVARWKRGEIQISPGRWKTPEEFQKLRQFGTPVGLPKKGADNEVAKWIGTLRIGPGVKHENLTLYPLVRFGPVNEFAGDRLPENQNVKIEEGGSPFQVQVTNNSPRDLFLFSGEILEGGKYARMVASDVVVPAGEAAPVSVFCIEPEADRSPAPFLSTSGSSFAPVWVRRAALSGKGQAAVWSALSSARGAKSEDIFKAFVDFPDRFPEVVGVAVAFGDQVVLAELFHDTELFSRCFRSLLQGLQGGRSPAGEEILFPNTVEGVRSLLQTAALSRAEPRGESLVFKQGTRASGEAKFAGGALYHLLLFSNVALKKEGRAFPAIPEEKMTTILDGVMEEINAGGDFSRIRAIQSLTLFDSPAAMQRLISLLKHSDPVIRKFAVLSLSEGGDASAVLALIEYAGTLDRHFPEVERVLFALSRLGDVRALPLFLSWLEGESRRVRLVLKHLPTLIGKIHDEAAWVSVMEKLLSCLKQSEAQKNSPVAGDVHTLVERLTGKRFSDASAFEAWWSEESSRKAFLESRSKD